MRELYVQKGQFWPKVSARKHLSFALIGIYFWLENVSFTKVSAKPLMGQDGVGSRDERATKDGADQDLLWAALEEYLCGP